jgi:hypothetical protein
VIADRDHRRAERCPGDYCSSSAISDSGRIWPPSTTIV